MEERLQRLERHVPGGRELLEPWLREASDEALFRVCVDVWAAEREMPRAEAVHLFLHAVRAGLLSLKWELVCPGCGLLVDELASFGSVRGHFRCDVCLDDRRPTLDEWVHVRFTVAPSVRQIRFHAPDELSTHERFFCCRVGRQVAMRNGQSLRQHLEEGMVLLKHMQRGEVCEVQFEVHDGLLLAEPACGMAVLAESSNDTTVIDAVLDDNGLHNVPKTVPRGRVHLTLRNDSSSSRTTWWFRSRDGYRFRDPAAFTAADLVHHPTYARLFPDDLVCTGEIRIRDVTILFSDLVGSTAMYRQIGDIAAYQAVREHFTALADVIAEHNGLWIKNMGDAVMATFRRPSDAVLAALVMRKRVRALTVARPMQLRLGIHCGPCIGVATGRRIDWFGQAVNIASRVQSLAAADEICVSEEAWKRAEMVVSDMSASMFHEPVRGLEAPIKGYRIAAEP